MSRSGKTLTVLGLVLAGVVYRERAGALAVPVLLFHGSDDSRVPMLVSDQLAAARPDVVEYEVFDGAIHVGPGTRTGNGTRVPSAASWQAWSSPQSGRGAPAAVLDQGGLVVVLDRHYANAVIYREAHLIGASQ